MRHHAFAVVSFILLAMPGAGRADSSFSHPAPNPGTPAGLLANVYHLAQNANQANPPTYQSVLNQVQIAASQSPNYAFVDTNINTTQSIVLSGNDGSATSAFLGSHAAATAASDAAPFATTVVDWRGWVYFPTAGTYTLSLSAADDAAAVYIGGNGTPGSGNLFLIDNYNHSIGTAGTGVPNPVHCDIFPINGVATTGWYPIEILYYNQYAAGGAGGAGINLSLTGPGTVQFATPRVFEANAYHWYPFTNGGTDVDPAGSDTVNASMVGNATVTGGALVTTGTPSASGAQLPASAIAQFFGSFTIEQWFTRADSGTNFQVLFSISYDTNHSIMAHPARADNGLFSVDIHPGNGQQYSLTAPAPAANTPVHMAVVYDAPSTTAKLYMNSQLVSRVVIPVGLVLSNIAGNNNTGVNGFSPWGDPIFNGSTDEFRIYRFALSQAQVTQDYIEHLGE